MWPLKGSQQVCKFCEFCLIRLSVNVWEGSIQSEIQMLNNTHSQTNGDAVSAIMSIESINNGFVQGIYEN